jgi:ATP-dependent helicase/nuclease subunit B
VRRLVTSFSVNERLDCVAEFLGRFAEQEILLVSPTRPAADELVRRRCIASGSVFGVHRFTLPLLAFTIASEHLAESGITPLSGVAIEALAARAVHACRADRGLDWFDPVATTPGFFRALGATITELRLNDVPPERVATLAPSGGDLARLLTQFGRELEEAKVADLPMIYRTATSLIREPGFRFKGRPLLLADITAESRLEQDLARALVDSASAVLATTHQRDDPAIQLLQTALGVTAEPLPSAQPDRALDRLRRNIFTTSAPSGDIDSSVEFLSATDESRECVEIARSMLSLAESGVPFDRMAICLRNPGTYQPLVEDALRRAGIPGFYTLGSRRPNPAGRALLALLACASEGLSASRFSEYLSIGQVPDLGDADTPTDPQPQWVPIQGELFPDIRGDEPAEELEEEEPSADDTSPVIAGSLQTPYQWERLLVDAAVIGGRDRWTRRLDGLDRELRKQIAEVADEDESLQRHLQRQLTSLQNLRRFALPVIGFLDDLPPAATWNEWLDLLERLAAMCLRAPETVLSVFAELRPMGNIGPVTLDEVHEVLTHRLTFLRLEPTERRYGKAFVATIPEISGMSFDVIFLPGLAEDIFPRKAFEDPLLLDSLRKQVSPDLAVQDIRIARERLLLHIAAGAAQSRLWISFPRMDLAQGRQRSPSFYALDVLRAMTGTIPSLSELQRQTAAHSQSLVGWPAPRQPNRAIDDTEYDLSTISQLLRLPAADANGRARYLLHVNANLARSLRTRAGRWRKRWTDGDGIVSSAAAVLELLARHRPTARPYSATALQQFAICPYRFLLHAIHRIQPRLETAAIERMDALTRGSFFHETQFRLLSELRALGLLPVRADILERVMTVADRVLDDVAERYCEELAPAIPRIWEREIEDIRWDLRGWLRAVAETGDGFVWKPQWFELSFGLSDVDQRDPASRPEPVELPGGIRVRGAIDMVEENDGAIRITDHKTGRAPQQPPGITGRGEILQPILYAQAAEILVGKPAASSRLFYCTDRGGYRIFEIPIDDHSRQSLSRVIAIIDESIANGFLPAAPRPEACTWCNYRLVCGPYEESRVRRKSPDRLSLLEELREMS